jgi:hypothetical protein
MASNDLDGRRIRAARNQSFFREVNERIEELASQWATTGPFLCECLDTRCAATVSISFDEYHRVRQDGDCFFVLAGHEVADIEEVIGRHDGYVIVRKLGAGGEIAVEMSPAQRANGPPDHV